MTDVTVTNHPEHRRYEASAGGAMVGFIDYLESSERVALIQTEVDASFEGRGVGGALARAALDDLRARGLRAVVVCRVVRGWLRTHHEYRDVLDNASLATVGD